MIYCNIACCGNDTVENHLMRYLSVAYTGHGLIVLPSPDDVASGLLTMLLKRKGFDSMTKLMLTCNALLL